MSLHIATPVEAMFSEAVQSEATYAEVGNSAPASAETGSSLHPSGVRSPAGAGHQPAPDVLVQLRNNLAQLDEMHSRLRFVMSEISYLLKR